MVAPNQYLVIIGSELNMSYKHREETSERDRNKNGHYAEENGRETAQYSNLVVLTAGPGLSPTWPMLLFPGWANGIFWSIKNSFADDKKKLVFDNLQSKYRKYEVSTTSS